MGSNEEEEIVMDNNDDNDNNEDNSKQPQAEQVDDNDEHVDIEEEKRIMAMLEDAAVRDEEDAIKNNDSDVDIEEEKRIMAMLEDAAVRDEKDAIKNNDNDVETDFQPTTVLVLLGSMHFEPSGGADMLSLKIADPSEMDDILKDACDQIKPNSLKQVHILLKSSSISSLFDDSILTAFYDGLLPGMDGELSIHVLPESSVLAEDMSVQPGDVDGIRMGLVASSYFLECEQCQDGGWVLTARKPELDVVDEVDEEEIQNDEQKELGNKTTLDEVEKEGQN